MAEEEINMGSSLSDASSVRKCHPGLLRHIACTTIDIDDDVLRAAKELARREKTTAGAIIRTDARGVECSDCDRARSQGRPRIPAFSERGAIVTNVQIDKSSERRMRSDEGTAQMEPSLPRRERKHRCLLLFPIQDQNCSVTITLA
jgi:hypothetical protein